MGFLHRGTSTRHTVVMPVSSRNSIHKRIAGIILSLRMVNIGLVGWISFSECIIPYLVMCRFCRLCAPCLFSFPPDFGFGLVPGMMCHVPST